MWTARLKAFSTWLLALTSGTALAVGAAIVTSGSLATSPTSSAVAPTSTLPTVPPTTDVSGTHTAPSSVPGGSTDTPRVTNTHVGDTPPTTVAPSKGYDDDEHEQHWGEQDDRDWDDD